MTQIFVEMFYCLVPIWIHTEGTACEIAISQLFLFPLSPFVENPYGNPVAATCIHKGYFIAVSPIISMTSNANSLPLFRTNNIRLSEL
jgi:hypothetical protein